MRIKEGDLYQHCYSNRLLSYSSLSAVCRSSIKWKEPLITLSTTETNQQTWHHTFTLHRMQWHTSMRGDSSRPVSVTDRRLSATEVDRQATFVMNVRFFLSITCDIHRMLLRVLPSYYLVRILVSWEPSKKLLIHNMHVCAPTK